MKIKIIGVVVFCVLVGGLIITMIAMNKSCSVEELQNQEIACGKKIYCKNVHSDDRKAKLKQRAGECDALRKAGIRGSCDAGDIIGGMEILSADYKCVPFYES